MDTNNNKKVLDLISTSIISEGGDGDALWLSKHTSPEDLMVIIEGYNQENGITWEVIKKEEHILWGSNQEWAIITDNESFFKSQPQYIILKIDY